MIVDECHSTVPAMKGPHTAHRTRASWIIWIPNRNRYPNIPKSLRLKKTTQVTIVTNVLNALCRFPRAVVIRYDPIWL